MYLHCFTSMSMHAHAGKRLRHVHYVNPNGVVCVICWSRLRRVRAKIVLTETPIPRFTQGKVDFQTFQKKIKHSPNYQPRRASNLVTVQAHTSRLVHGHKQCLTFLTWLKKSPPLQPTSFSWSPSLGIFPARVPTPHSLRARILLNTVDADANLKGRKFERQDVPRPHPSEFVQIFQPLTSGASSCCGQREVDFSSGHFSVESWILYSKLQYLTLCGREIPSKRPSAE